MASCDKCVEIGTFWNGEPSGKEVTYEGTRAYTATPKAGSRKGVLFVPDIYGIDHINNRLLIDKYAEKGFIAVLPDWFDKHPFPKKEHQAGDRAAFLKWIDTLNPDVTGPYSEKFIEFLKSKGATSIGVVGYCWGGRPAVKAASTDQVKALVVNHGSFITDEDMEQVKQPSLFNGSENDPHIPKERFGKLEQILKGNNVPADFKFFKGASHGWTCRGDNGDKATAEKIEDAFDRGVAWFEKYL